LMGVLRRKIREEIGCELAHGTLPATAGITRSTGAITPQRGPLRMSVLPLVGA
jgi:hypothetical protein